MSPIALLPRPDDELDHRNPLVLTLEGVLSPGVCGELIERIEAAGPEPAPISAAGGFVMRPDLRNNTRVMFDDAALAGALFDHVSPHVPARLEGAWRLCGANERLRCYRYGPGQFFAPHFDGAFVRHHHERSLLTLIVYLNACEAGGETKFLDLELTVRPAPGAALVFNHHLLHEGARVDRGVKYALRTDLMYRREG